MRKRKGERAKEGGGKRGGEEGGGEEGGGRGGGRWGGRWGTKGWECETPRTGVLIPFISWQFQRDREREAEDLRHQYFTFTAPFKLTVGNFRPYRTAD